MASDLTASKISTDIPWRLSHMKCNYRLSCSLRWKGFFSEVLHRKQHTTASKVSKLISWRLSPRRLKSPNLYHGVSVIWSLTSGLCVVSVEKDFFSEVNHRKQHTTASKSSKLISWRLRSRRLKSQNLYHGVSVIWNTWPFYETRGHSMKLNFYYSRSDCRRYFLSNRCIGVWNNKLTENKVSITSLNIFKIAIDKILVVFVDGAPLLSKM